MKKFAFAVLASSLAFPALAGGLQPIEVEPAPIVVESNPASSVSPLLILGLLILIGVLISRQDDDDDDIN